MFWKEYSFGAFILLVMVLSALLTCVSFLLPLSVLAELALFGLPAIFFIFTFVDLRRVMRTRKSTPRTFRVTVLFLTCCMAWQCFSPLAPVNFLVRNAPQVFRATDNALSPRFRKGDILLSNSLAYRASLFFISKPQLFSIPEHGEIVRFIDSSGARRIGLVIGVPGEQVEVSEGVLMANSLPENLADMLGAPVSGRVALTDVTRGSILILTVHLGTIDQVFEVPIVSVLGKVHKLL